METSASFGRGDPSPCLYLKGGVLSIFLGRWCVFSRGGGGRGFPALEERGSWSPLSPGVLSSGLKWGAIPSGRENEVCVLWQGVKGSAPLPVY